MEHDALRSAVKALDPAPRDTDLPEDLWSATVALRDIDARSGAVPTHEMSRRDATRGPRWRPTLVAAAAFVSVIVLGAVLWLAAPWESTPPAVPTTKTQPPDSSTAGPVAITSRFGSLAAGTHLLDSFNTPIVFTTENSNLFIQANASGYFAMSAPASRGPDDRDMVIIELTSLSDPSAPNSPSAGQGDGWPADDFDGWLDNLAEGIEVTNRETTTLGGLPATRADLVLDGIECLPSTSYCVLFDRAQRKPLNPGPVYRIWVVHQGLDRPIAVIVGSAGDPSDASWREAFELVVSTIAFEAAP